MILLFAVGLGLDRALSSRLFVAPHDYVPAYRSFPEYAMGVKLDQYRDVPGRLDAAFIGNSRTLFGVDPVAFERRLTDDGVRARTYNLGMPSVDVRFWPTFFERYDKHPAPRHLFLAILPRDLDKTFTNADAIVPAFLASSGFANRDMSSINRWAEERMAHLFVLRGRASDLQLISGTQVVHREKLDIRPIHLRGTHGQGALPPANVLSAAELRRQQERLAVRHGSEPFVLDPAKVRALIELNRWVRAGGGCLTLYTTPLLYDREQWGTIEKRQGFTAALRRLVPTLPGVSFHDVGGRVQSRYTARDFGDGDHLNPRGAERFSGALADVLAPEMAAPCASR